MEKQFEIRSSGDSVENITKALLARAHRLFPNSGAITGELAAMDMIIVYRIKHEHMLATGEPWVAIVNLTTRWDSRSEGRIIMSLDDMVRIVGRYDRVVSQASALGLVKPREEGFE